MAIGGGDFNLGFRYGALKASAQMAADVSGSDSHHHFPAARRMPIGWTEGEGGTWTSSEVDPKLWEVFCAECGDTDGPAEQQSPAVQHLRGPYRHEHGAKKAATAHYDAH